MCSLSLRLNVLENKVLRGIYGVETNEVTEKCRNLHLGPPKYEQYWKYYTVTFDIRIFIL
jgi:hypothetical protein